MARILRLTSEEIDMTRPLDDLGMDSLMSLELRMAIEGRFGVELPVVAISSGVNVNELAARLIAGAKAGKACEPGGEREAGPGELERHLMQQHGLGDIGVEEMLAVAEAIEENRSAVTQPAMSGDDSRAG